MCITFTTIRQTTWIIESVGIAYLRLSLTGLKARQFFLNALNNLNLSSVFLLDIPMFL